MKLTICIAVTGLAALAIAQPATIKPAADPAPLAMTRVKDIATIRGVRSNQLVGYGLVIGLDGTGDTKSAAFTAQSLANMLQRYGVTMRPQDLKVKNVAAVMVTADLAAFMRPGSRIDVTVSSVGDARSLQGGTLIQTPLMGADTKVYAVAQGAISIGGFSFGNRGTGVQKNHVTAGRIPDGALVERDVQMDFAQDGDVTIELRRPDFANASRVVEAIRAKYPSLNPFAPDAGSIQLRIPSGVNPVTIVADIQALAVSTDQPARIVVNERTGVVIIGGNVRIKPVVVAQGGIKVEIRTGTSVSQPNPLSPGKTTTVKNTEVNATEEKGSIAALKSDGATVDLLVKALQALGVTPQDLISILQALKEQGALEAELVIE